MVQWVKFINFCLYFGLLPFPASTAALMWYAQYLANKFKAHSSVVNYLSGLKTLHVLLELPIDGFTGLLLKLTLKGLRRLNSHILHQAFPMTPNILLDIRSTLGLTNPEDATFWAICLVAFYLLFRKSNLVPVNVTGWCAHQLLCRKDLWWTDHCIMVTIQWSKTNQFGEPMTFPLPRIPGSRLCPMFAMENMIMLNPISPHELCFVRPGGHPFMYYQFHSKLRKALKRTGHPECMYSSHSFRRGGTTFAFLSGVPSELIKQLGGWKSDCYLHYLDLPVEARTAATELMKIRIQAVGW